MEDLQITTKIEKFTYGTHNTYQVRTRSEKYGYELINIAGSEAEANAIAKTHETQLITAFTPKFSDVSTDDTDKKPKKKKKASTEFSITENNDIAEADGNIMDIDFNDK